MKWLVILSGGMDSTTVLYKAVKQCDEVEAITFNYWQNHSKEIDFAKKSCKKLDVKHKIVDITFMKNLSKSALTNWANSIPEWHYEEENMKQTVVPNRNMILTAIAAWYATNIGASKLYLWVHSWDHAIYPDCRPEFIESLQKTLEVGMWEDLEIKTPYLDNDKIGIIADGKKLGVPYEDTWTCYKGEWKACWKCWSCQERLEAFEENNIEDPLEYK